MKKYKYVILLIILTFNSQINCQIHGRSNLYDHSFAVGFVESSPDRFITNPAKLKFADTNLLGMSISPSMFGLKELNAGNVFFTDKFNEDFRYGASMYGMGGDLYNEFSVGLDVAYLLDERFTFGASTELSRLFVKDFNSYYNLMVTLGSIVNISDELAAGISFNNLLRQAYANETDAVYQRALIGLAYKAENGFIFEFTGVVNLNHSSGFVFGLRKNILDVADVRMSVGSQPKSYEIGIKFDIIDRFLFNFNLFYDLNFGYNKKLFLYGNI